MNPALQAAFAALTQEITGLSTAVTLLANRQTGGAVPANRRPAAAGDGGSDVGVAIAAGVGKVVAAFAPMIALSNVLSQTVSGFQVFAAAMKVFSAAVAPLLLPVFAVLAAAVLTASDILWAKLQPALKDFYEFVVSAMLPGVGAFLDVIEEATDAVKAFVEWVGKNKEQAQKAGEAAWQYGTPFGWGEMIGGAPTDLLGGTGDSPSAWEHVAGWAGGGGVGPGPGGAPAADPAAARRDADAVASETRLRELWRNGDAETKADIARMVPDHVALWEQGKRKWGEDEPGKKKSWKERMEEVGRGMRAGPPGAAGGEGGPDNPGGGQFGQALRDVLQSLRQQMGPPAAFGDLASVGKNAQLAALNTDPLERRNMERGLQAFDALIEALPYLKVIARNTADRPKETYTPWGGGGDF